MNQKFGYSASTDQYTDDVKKSFLLGCLWGITRTSNPAPVNTIDDDQESQIATTIGPNAPPETYPRSVISIADTEEELVAVELQEAVMQKIEDVLAIGAGEIFEPGAESEFAEALTEGVRRYGSSAVRVIANHILGGAIGATVASEALCILGDLDDTLTLDDRLSLLIKSLENESSRIREGAILGLSRLGDPRSIDYLKASHRSEPYGFLQQDMSQVLQVLERRV